jgi:hypothetical protein
VPTTDPFWDLPYASLDDAADMPALSKMVADQIRADLDKPPVCILTNNTTLGQNLTDGSASILTLDTTVQDTAGMYSAPNAAVVKLAGTHDIDADCAFPADPDGSRFLAVLLNGAELRRFEIGANQASGRGTTCSVHWSGPLALNDRIQLQGWQNSGGDMRLLATATTVVRLAVRFRHT